MTAAARRAALPRLETGKLQVGSDIPYAPFEFGDPPDYQGFDVDVVNEIGKRLESGRRVREDTVRPDLPQPGAGALRHGRLGGHDHTRAAEDGRLSNPYFPADQSLMVKRDSDIKRHRGPRGQSSRRPARNDWRRLCEGGDRGRQVRRTYDLVDDALQGAADGPDRRGDHRLPGRQVRRALEEGSGRRADHSHGRALRDVVQEGQRQPAQGRQRADRQDEGGRDLRGHLQQVVPGRTRRRESSSRAPAARTQAAPSQWTERLTFVCRKRGASAPLLLCRPADRSDRWTSSSTSTSTSS